MTDLTAAVPPLVPAPLNNRRDLGGMAVAGGVIRPNALWRADDVSVVLPDEAELLVSEGLATIIDLRSERETAHTGRGPLGALPVEYRNIPLTRGGGDPSEYQAHLKAGTDTPEVVGGWYAGTVVAEAENLVAGYRVVAESPGATVVHCAAGKDRTGLFVGALLAHLGADPEDIAQDYARSELVLPAIMRRVTDNIGHLLGEGVVHFRAAIDATGPVSPFVGAHIDSMRAMLRARDEQLGGVDRVLADAGWTADDSHRIRERMVVAAG